MSTVDTQANRRRPNVSTLKMGLFLYVAGPDKPTEATSREVSALDVPSKVFADAHTALQLGWL